MPPAAGHQPISEFDRPQFAESNVEFAAACECDS
jgi:hypothetical protein